MHRKSEIQELSAADVENVAGGMIITAFAVKIALAVAKGGSAPPEGGGAKNDPAEMFQQIMQQLAEGA